MKNVLILCLTLSLCSCGLNSGDSNTEDDDRYFITSKFDTTWNIYEKLAQNKDGSITYQAVPWGGLVGTVKENNMPVDWSGYESIQFEFAEPTKVATQIVVTSNLMVWGKPGITSLTCHFDGQDVRSVSEVALQASDTTTIVVKNVSLMPNVYVQKSTPLWTGHCVQGDWADGFVVAGDKFNTAKEGDKIEIVFTTDKSNPDISIWLLKTIYNGTATPLEGNYNELNEWGCAKMAIEGSRYRIVLTDSDVIQLREHGLFVNGYYNIITECNLLQKEYAVEEEENF